MAENQTKNEREKEVIAIVVEALEKSPELLKALKSAITRLEQSGELRR